MALEMVDLSIPVSLAAWPSERGMRVALRVSGLLIVAPSMARNGRYNHDTGCNARKRRLCVAEYSCLALHVRLHAMVAAAASPEARLPSKAAMRGQVGDGQMPHLIYPQPTGTRPGCARRISTRLRLIL
jgi:hypothetical protein